jgi:gamma-glutamyl-gamma-aminobutyraldehyde dehydrogenase
MTDLLSREEYAAIAKNIDFPRTAFIGGKFCAGRRERMPTINPATGEVICEIFGPVLSISKCALNRSSHRSGQ